MNIIKLMLLSRQMKNRRHEKNNMVAGIPPLTFTANKTGTLKNYRIYGNTETKLRSYSGTAPLSFPIVDGAVSNYRIYGNTENGESVGDRTENLFDEGGNKVSGYINDYGGLVEGENPIQTYDYMPISPNSDYTFIGYNYQSVRRTIRVAWFDSSKNFIWRTYESDGGIAHTKKSPANAYYARLSIDVEIKQIMFNAGETALPYEPYGYRIPIANNSETANIYLDEPLRKVGDEAEYVDYATQKWHRVRKNLFDEKYEGIDENNPDSTIVYKSINVGAGRFTMSSNTPTIAGDYCNLFLLSGIVDRGASSQFDGVSIGVTRTVTSINGYVTIGYRYYDNVNPKLYQTQLERGNAATGYEPYIENTEVDITVPALPAQSSTNSLSIGTTVQPSSVAVEVDEVVSCGDKVTDSRSVNYGKYKIPVTLTADSAETTEIHLDEPLAKSENGADYIDYATQKRHNSDGTESSVTLPEIAVAVGTNTLTVGTEVQPSRVELTRRIKEAQTNGSGNT